MRICDSGEAWEHTENLYLLEVLIDHVHIDEEMLEGPKDEIRPTIIKIKFYDFPEMQVEPNALATPEMISSKGELGKQPCKEVIPTAPDEWTIGWATDLRDFSDYPQYRVEIPVPSGEGEQEAGEERVLAVLVPKVAVQAGEGLRYIYTAVQKQDDSLLKKAVNDQVKRQREKPIIGEEPKNVTQNKFASGKSCLFPMTPFNLIRGLKTSPLYVQVYRPEIFEGDCQQSLVGQVKVMLGKAFVKAVTLANSSVMLPVSAHMEDVFAMYDVFGRETGTVGLFVRLASFGSSEFPQYDATGSVQSGRAKAAMQDSGMAAAPASGHRRLLLEPMVAEEFHPLTLSSRFGLQEADHIALPVPWRKHWEDVRKMPKKPKKRMKMKYRPMPPPPPQPCPPPFDMAAMLPDLPRCGPHQQPPCFRVPGVAPLPRCENAMWDQLRREEHTLPTQTEASKSPLPPCRTPCTDYTGTQGLDNRMGDPGPSAGQGSGLGSPPCQEDKGSPIRKGPMTGSPTSKFIKACTCPKIPGFLVPEPSKKSPACTCAELMQKLCGDKPSSAPVASEVALELSTGKTTSKGQTSETSQKRDKKKRKKKKGEDDSDDETNSSPPSSKGNRRSKDQTQKDKGRGSVEPDARKASSDSDLKLPGQVKEILYEEVDKYEKRKKQALTKQSTPVPLVKSESKLDMKQNETDDDTGKPTAKKTKKQKTEPSSETVGTEAPQGGVDAKLPKKMTKKQMYIYTSGMYPGFHVGHKHCVRPIRLVPKTMGWLWNIGDLSGIVKPGRGWRPGAVRSSVNDLLTDWRKKPGRAADVDSDTDVMRGMKRLRPTSPRAKAQGSRRDLANQRLNPTLHLHKKEGYYYISVYPTRTPSQDEIGEDPKPIQFKIDAKHPDGRGDDEVGSDSSTSSEAESYEIEFIAPSALRKAKPRVSQANMESQYNMEDFASKKTSKKKESVGGKSSTKDSGKKKNSKKGKKGKGKKGKKSGAWK